MAPTEATLIDNCAEKVAYICKNFLDVDFFGTATGTTNFLGSSAAHVTRVKAFLTYATFKNDYLSGWNPTATQISAYMGQLRVRTDATSFKTWPPSATYLDILEINMGAWVPSALLQKLDDWTLLYNSITPANFSQVFVPGTTSSTIPALKLYAVSSNTKSDTTTSRPVWLAAMQREFGNSDITQLMIDRTDFTMVQRILLSFIYTTHLYLLLALMEKISSVVTVAVTKASYTATLKPWVDAAFFQLLRINSVSSSQFNLGDDDVKKLTEGLNKRMQTYSNTSQKLQGMDTRIQDLKLGLTTEKDLLAGEQVYKRKSWYFIVSAFVVCVVLLLAGFGTAFVEAESGFKLHLLTWITAAAVIATCVLVFTSKQVLKETFESNINPLATDAVNWSGTDFVQTYVKVVLVELGTYYNDTLNIGLLLRNFKNYGTMNSSLQKEYTYFNNTQTQMSQAQSTVRDQHRVLNLDAKLNVTRMYLILSILVVFLFTLLIHEAADEHPVVQQIALWVSGFFVVMCLVFYIYESTKFVRTDPSKYYWGRPNLDSVKA